MLVKFASVLIGSLFLLQKAKGQMSSTTGLFGRNHLCAAPEPSQISPVIRPKPLVRPTNTFPLLNNLAKGPSFRRPAIVEHCLVPPPEYPQSDVPVFNINNCNTCAGHCSTCGTNLNQQCPNCACDVIDTSRAYESACSFIKAPPLADPVSLAIAYKQCQNQYVQKIAEEKLNRGFIRIPVDKEKSKLDDCDKIPSELNLYEMNGQPVELKASNGEHTCFDNLSEEAEEALLNLAISEEACEVPTAKRPSLVELGYAPAQTGYTSFVNMPCAPAEAEYSVVCNHGSKGGTVKHNNVGKIEQIVNSPGDTLCDTQENADKCIIPPTTVSCNSKEHTADRLVKSQNKVSKSSSRKSRRRHHQF